MSQVESTGPLLQRHSLNTVPRDTGCGILARGMLYIVNYRVFPKFLLLFHVVSISVFSTGYLVYFLFHIAYFRLLLFHSLLLASITFSGSRFAYINFSFSDVYKLSFLCSGGLFFSL